MATIQCATYNAGLSSGPFHMDYSSWLLPTISEESRDRLPLSAPDIYAVGFQEALPAHLSLLGFSKYILDARDSEISEQIQRGTGAAYSLVKKTIAGGTALFVYVKDEAEIADKMEDIQVSSAGLGPLWMINKCAVGVRLTVRLTEDEATDVDHDADDHHENDHDDEQRALRSSRDLVYTFVCAHLTAHGYNVISRDNDWTGITQRLLFELPSSTYTPSPSSPSSTLQENKLVNIYDTSYLFVLGDLNYRLDFPQDGQGDESSFSQICSQIESDPTQLLQYDQLKNQQSHGKTLQFLHEGNIKFKPSFKFEAGSEEYDRKRAPSWCDRILFASWADKIDSSAVKVRLYRSIMNVSLSDHKPVTAMLSLPKLPDYHQPLILPHRPQISSDYFWKSKWLIGQCLSKIGGVGWTIGVLLGFGDGRIGTVNFLLIILTTMLYTYWRKLLFKL